MREIRTSGLTRGRGNLPPYSTVIKRKQMLEKDNTANLSAGIMADWRDNSNIVWPLLWEIAELSGQMALKVS